MEETHNNMRFVIMRLRVRSTAGETVRCALRLVLSSGCEIQQYRTAGLSMSQSPTPMLIG